MGGDLHRLISYLRVFHVEFLYIHSFCYPSLSGLHSPLWIILWNISAISCTSTPVALTVSCPPSRVFYRKSVALLCRRPISIHTSLRIMPYDTVVICTPTTTCYERVPRAPSERYDCSHLNALNLPAYRLRLGAKLSGVKTTQKDRVQHEKSLVSM